MATLRVHALRQHPAPDQPSAFCTSCTRPCTTCAGSQPSTSSCFLAKCLPSWPPSPEIRAARAKLTDSFSCGDQPERTHRIAAPLVRCRYKRRTDGPWSCQNPAAEAPLCRPTPASPPRPRAGAWAPPARLRTASWPSAPRPLGPGARPARAEGTGAEIAARVTSLLLVVIWMLQGVWGDVVLCFKHFGW